MEDFEAGTSLGSGGIFKNAAYEILKQEERLMTSGEITKLAVERKLLRCTGKTPENTMASALYTEVRKKAGTTVFIKPKEGLFGLKAWLNEPWLLNWLAQEGIEIQDFLDPVLPGGDPPFNKRQRTSYNGARIPSSAAYYAGASGGGAAPPMAGGDGVPPRSQRSSYSGRGPMPGVERPLPGAAGGGGDLNSNLDLLLHAANEIDNGVTAAGSSGSHDSEKRSGSPLRSPSGRSTGGARRRSEAGFARPPRASMDGRFSALDGDALDIAYGRSGRMGRLDADAETSAGDGEGDANGNGPDGLHSFAAYRRQSYPQQGLSLFQGSAAAALQMHEHGRQHPLAAPEAAQLLAAQLGLSLGDRSGGERMSELGNGAQAGVSPTSDGLGSLSLPVQVAQVAQATTQLAAALGVSPAVAAQLLAAQSSANANGGSAGGARMSSGGGGLMDSAAQIAGSLLSGGGGGPGSGLPRIPVPSLLTGMSFKRESESGAAPVLRLSLNGTPQPLSTMSDAAGRGPRLSHLSPDSAQNDNKQQPQPQRSSGGAPPLNLLNLDAAPGPVGAATAGSAAAAALAPDSTRVRRTSLYGSKDAAAPTGGAVLGDPADSNVPIGRAASEDGNASGSPFSPTHLHPAPRGCAGAGHVDDDAQAAGAATTTSSRRPTDDGMTAGAAGAGGDGGSGRALQAPSLAAAAAGTPGNGGRAPGEIALASGLPPQMLLSQAHAAGRLGAPAAAAAPARLMLSSGSGQQHQGGLGSPSSPSPLLSQVQGVLAGLQQQHLDLLPPVEPARAGDVAEADAINRIRQQVMEVEARMGPLHPECGKAYVLLARVLEHKGTLWSLTMAERALLRAWTIVGHATAAGGVAAAVNGSAAAAGGAAAASNRRASEASMAAMANVAAAAVEAGAAGATEMLGQMPDSFPTFHYLMEQIRMKLRLLQVQQQEQMSLLVGLVQQHIGSAQAGSRRTSDDSGMGAAGQLQLLGQTPTLQLHREPREHQQQQHHQQQGPALNSVLQQLLAQGAVQRL